MSSLASQLSRSSAFRVLSLAIRTATGVILTPYIVHMLGDRLYGFWTLIGTFLGYYGVLDFGLTTAVCQQFSVALGNNNRQEGNRVFNTAFRMLVGVGVGAVGISAGLASTAKFICTTDSDAALFSQLTLIMGIGIALSFPLRALSAVLVAHLRFDIQSKLDLLTLALRTMLIVGTLSTGHGIVALAWVTVLAELPSSGLLAYTVLKKYRWVSFQKISDVTRIRKNLYSYSFYQFIITITDRLRYQVDPFVVTLFTSLSAVAHYNIASILAQQFSALQVAAMSVTQPYLSRLHATNDRQRLLTVLSLSTKISVCSVGLLTFGLILWGKAFIFRWMGPAYLDAYPPLVALVLATAFALAQQPAVDLMFATAQHRIYAYANAIEGVMNLLFSLALASRMGMLGVALGTLIPMAIMRLFVIPWWFCGAINLSKAQYFGEFFGNVAKCCLVILPLAILFKPMIKPDYPTLFLSAVLACVLYGCASMYVMFNQANRRTLYGTVRGLLIFNRPQGVKAPDSESVAV